MGPVVNGGGEEEEENLRAIKTLCNIFDSFAKQPCDERAPVAVSRRVTKIVYIGLKLWERVSWVKIDR